MLRIATRSTILVWFAQEARSWIAPGSRADAAHAVPLEIVKKSACRRGSAYVTCATARSVRSSDSACQYAHPNAEPVFNYLVRWDDGQVSALTEHALDARGEIELIEED